MCDRKTDTSSANSSEETINAHGMIETHLI